MLVIDIILGISIEDVLGVIDVVIEMFGNVWGDLGVI